MKKSAHHLQVVVDANNAVLGRVASYAAKQALLGFEVIIVHAEKAMITGREKSISEHYLAQRGRGGTSLKGPISPSKPEMIVKRTIRGMLPYKAGRGREAFKRIRCYAGLPSEFATAKIISLQREMQGSFITVEQLSRRLK